VDRQHRRRRQRGFRDATTFPSTLASDATCLTPGVGGTGTSPGNDDGAAVAVNGDSRTPVPPPGGTQIFQFAYRIY
jgi:hypothetical protein